MEKFMYKCLWENKVSNKKILQPYNIKGDLNGKKDNDNCAFNNYIE